MKLALRSGLAAALFFFFSACGQPSTRPLVVSSPVVSETTSGNATLKVAAWNVENFFDTVDDPYKDDVPSRAKQAAKVEKMAGVLKTLEADFVALEEVENIDSLRQLNESLHRPYPQLGLIEGNDTIRGIDVAFLSRVPVSRVVSHRERLLPKGKGVPRGYKFSRDCLEVGLATSPPITLFINHLKAQTGNKKDSANKRRAQAIAVAQIVAEVSERYPEGVEVVLGDLNDEPKSWSLEPLQADLVDVFEGWPSNLRTTHRSRQGGSILDHILVSPDAEPRLGEAKVWQNLAKGTSDHDPVSLEILFDKAPVSPEQREWSK